MVSGSGPGSPESNNRMAMPPRLTLATGATPLWVSVADFNNDGNPDLAIANNGAPTNTLSGNSVTIILGNGDGTFNTAGAQSFRAGNGPTSIAVADYNIDGFLDLAFSRVMK